jgi:hypothetical protein
MISIDHTYSKSYIGEHHANQRSHLHQKMVLKEAAQHLTEMEI